jgi:hypothetical protein
MGRDFVARGSWGFIAFLVALGALVAALAALFGASDQGQRIAIDPLAASGGSKVVDRIELDAGDKKKLFANDDFKVTGECVENAPDDFTAEVSMKTLKNNAIIFSTYDGNETDFLFDKADGPYHFTGYEASGTDPLFYGYDYYQEFYAESPGGRVLIGRVSNGVHVSGADCIFSGLFVS